MKQLLLNNQTRIFGTFHNSWASNRDPNVKWEVGQHGVTLTRQTAAHIETVLVPWSNIGALIEQHPIPPAKDGKR